MTEQGRKVTEISNPVWLWQVAFLVDITVHIHFCNLKLQKANSVLMIHTIGQKLLLLHGLLALFEKQLSKTNLDRLEKFLIFSSETCRPFRSGLLLSLSAN